ncbi:MAG: cytochrome c [Hyphomicrobiaceae bacterium]
MKVIFGFLLACFVIAGAGYWVIWSGAYDIRATTPHTAAVAWTFETAMRQGVRHGAASVAPGPESNDELLRSGAREYAETCVTCHGAPGKDSEKWAMSMESTPPDLGEAAKEWSRREIFWIAQNGIKMSGMPAFGPSHSEAKLWALATFVKAMPGMNAERFEQLVGQPLPAGETGQPPAAAQGRGG